MLSESATAVGHMRNARKVSDQSLSREEMANRVTYQLGTKSDFSEPEEKFIGREERVLRSLESRIKN